MLTPPSKSHLSCLHYLTYVGIAKLVFSKIPYSLILLPLSTACPSNLGWIHGYFSLVWSTTTTALFYFHVVWIYDLVLKKFLSMFCILLSLNFFMLFKVANLPNLDNSLLLGCLLPQFARMSLCQECLWLPSQSSLTQHKCPVHSNWKSAFLGHASSFVALLGWL